MTNQKILFVLAMVASTASVFPVAEAGILRGSAKTEDSLTQEERNLKSGGMGMGKGGKMGGKSNKNKGGSMKTNVNANSLNFLRPNLPPPLIIAPSTNTYITVATLQEECNAEWSALGQCAGGVGTACSNCLQSFLNMNGWKKGGEYCGRTSCTQAGRKCAPQVVSLFSCKREEAPVESGGSGGSLTGGGSSGGTVITGGGSSGGATTVITGGGSSSGTININQPDCPTNSARLFTGLSCGQYIPDGANEMSCLKNNNDSLVQCDCPGQFTNPTWTCRNIGGGSIGGGSGTDMTTPDQGSSTGTINVNPSSGQSPTVYAPMEECNKVTFDLNGVPPASGDDCEIAANASFDILKCDFPGTQCHCRKDQPLWVCFPSESD